MGTHPIFESDFDCLTDMSSGFKIKKKYEKDKRSDACLRKIAFFNYEMKNNIIMGRQIDAKQLDQRLVYELRTPKDDVPEDHPPNCGQPIKSIDKLPSGKVISLYWPFPLTDGEEEDNTYFEALVCNMETVTGTENEFRKGSLEPDILLAPELIDYHKKHPNKTLEENAEALENELILKLKEKRKTHIGVQEIERE